jgi:hypothetical protein
VIAELHSVLLIFGSPSRARLRLPAAMTHNGHPQGKITALALR